ncbi:MAG: hypothetical protein AAGI24_15365 [Pseudomonadota bacterium]
MADQDTAMKGQSLIPLRAVSRDDALRASGSIRTRATRAVNELVVAEFFLVQATIESAAALGAGLSALRRSPATLGDIVKITTPQVLEPYKERFQALKDVRQAARGQDRA